MRISNYNENVTNFHKFDAMFEQTFNEFERVSDLERLLEKDSDLLNLTFHETVHKSFRSDLCLNDSFKEGSL